MICCSIAAKTKEKAIKDMLFVKTNADLIEIRLDYIKDISLDALKEIISKKKHPAIITYRKDSEGGNSGLDEKQRISFLKKAIDLGAEYIDIEYSSGQKIISELIKIKNRSKIIVSYHNFKELPINLKEIYTKIKSTKCDIIKIACIANSIDDNLKIFELIKKAKSEKINIIALCMGEKGEISRILSVAYGSMLTYGSLEQGKESAPGQISCEYLKRVYGIDKLNIENLRIYGLVGNPVSKSRGFIVHNLTFKEYNLNAIYVNFLVDDLKDFIGKFRQIFSGLSITMPFKGEIMNYLDEIDEKAKKIGAINTVILKGKKLIGYNTDSDGAIEAIEEKTSIKGKKVVLFGAGGTARAIAYGIIEKQGKLIISNRTAEKGKKLAQELKAEFKKAEDINWNKIDILINATSVGMMPNTNESPVDKKYLKKMIVFDAIYSPLVTKLLIDAEKNRCEIISGVNMFINQAVKQFEIWTGIKPDRKFMEDKILEYVLA